MRNTVFAVAVVTSLMVLGGCRRQASAPRMRLGVWIDELSLCEGGSVDKIAAKAKRSGVSYLIVRTHGLWDQIDGRSICAKKVEWYRTCPEELFLRLLETCHHQGIDVYAWSYIYGTPGCEEIEVGMAKQAIDAGADGYVANVETQFTRRERYDTAARICEKIGAHIKQTRPGLFTSYSTFARITPRTAGYTFPAIHFSRIFSTVMPQTYWADWHWQPGPTVQEIDRQWKERYERWRRLDSRDGKDRTSAIRPIIHTGHAYRAGLYGTAYIPASDLLKFLQEVRVLGYSEANVWVWRLMGKEHWLVLRQFSKLKPILASQQTVQRTGFWKRSWGWIWGHWWIGLGLCGLTILVSRLWEDWRNPRNWWWIAVSLLTIFLLWWLILAIGIIALVIHLGVVMMYRRQS